LRHARPVRAGVDFLNTHHLEPSLNRKSPLSVALCALATTPELAAAQEITARPATADACQAISSNAQRLACYDAALGYVAPSPREADLAADAADRATVVAADAAGEDERARERCQLDLDPDTRATIADAGRGHLLDSRWELAKASQLGIFQLRAYKPVYVLPGFCTSRTNATPTSPNPNNTVATPERLDSIEAKFQDRKSVV